MLSRAEILAPAGTFESVRAAVNSGADAVYLGGGMFSARAYAGNFNEKELIEVIDYCHIRGVKVYMAVNTLLKDSEIEKLPSYMEPYYRQGVDGVIVQDMGAVRVLSRCFPDLPLHGSTQMSISSTEGALFLRKLGLTRFVPSRELSLEELIHIRENADIELETFVHGAMCYSYSGRCLMSSFAGGRSGNRGRCAQPCRKLYQIDGHREYALSMKDMCMLKDVRALISAGIDSFKIEGRMKKPEYVAAASRAYREVRDAVLAGEDESSLVSTWEKKLLDVYNRGGFCSGYYYMRHGRAMLATDRPNHAGLPVGEVVRVAPPHVELKLSEDIHPGDIIELRYGKYEIELTCPLTAGAGEHVSLKAKEFRHISLGMAAYRTRNEQLLDDIRSNLIEKEKRIVIDAHLLAHIGRNISLELTTPDGLLSVKAEGPGCAAADRRPVTAGQLEERIGKTGGTPYELRITSDVDEGLFVPMGAVSELRRQALQLMTEKIAAAYHRDISERILDERRKALQLYRTEQSGISEIKAVQDGLTGGVPLITAAKGGQMCDLPLFTAGAARAEQVSILKKYKWLRAVILDYNVRKYTGELKDAGFDVIWALPDVLRQRGADRLTAELWDLCTGSAGGRDVPNGLFIRNLDELGLIIRLGYKGALLLGSSLYAYNSQAQAFYREHAGDVIFMSPDELTAAESDRLVYRTVPKIYGHQRVMTAANCIFESILGLCGRGQNDELRFADDIGNAFYAVRDCESCCSAIYNGVPTCVTDKLGFVVKNCKACYIEFTVEDTKTVERVLDGIYADIRVGDVFMPDRYTRGHCYKGVE